MTDNADKPQRPNANYKLSKPDNAGNPKEEELVFHYNREHRLAKAPQSVKDLYADKKQYRFNLLRPLIADKPRAFVFFTILIICAAIFLLSILGYFDKWYSLDGNKIEITGTKFEGTTIVVLKKTLKKGQVSPYSGPVDIAVSPAEESEDEELPVFPHRIFFSMEPVEEYRFIAPFDSPELLMVLQTEKDTIYIKLKTE